MIPDCILDRQADEAAEQQVVVDLLDELALTVHAREHLQQHGSHELFGRDARAAWASYMAEKRSCILASASFVHVRIGRSGRVAETKASGLTVENRLTLKPSLPHIVLPRFARHRNCREDDGVLQQPVQPRFNLHLNAGGRQKPMTRRRWFQVNLVHPGAIKRLGFKL